jgi:glutamyl-tRNA reductase
MARIAAEALRGTARIVVVNRDVRRAAATARRLGGRAATLRDLPEILEATDVLITATSADRRIVGKRVLARVSSRLGGRRLWILDLGVPRNVDPAAADLHGVTLLTIDDLGPWANSAPPPSALAQAERQIRRDAERSLEILRPREADLAVSLRRAAEDVRRSEVERALEYLPHATERDRAVLDKLAERLVNRLLHGPTEFVRRLQAEEDETAMAAFLETWDMLGGRE